MAFHIMKLNAISLSVLSIFSLILTTLPSPAQTRPQQRRNNTNINNNTNPTVVNDWSKNAKTEAEFMQGCVGQQSLSPAQRKAKENFCKCAFNAYKARYTPQMFFQINGLASQVGQDGPRLVNLMMKPELDRCSAQTNYFP